ncbi:MAG TPA: hypothetical protein VHG08_12460 [Longimicrobium sp.]|nr:hypothetical protein [Longimicrobium sp.]
MRDIQQWAETAPERRTNLFAGLAEARFSGDPPSTVEPSLAVFEKLRREVVPQEELADACWRVWQWAEEASLPETAAHFAEAAALLAPESPVYANDAGWACRRVALYDRSAAWYQRALRLAVRERSRHEAVRALLGHGAVLKEAGQPAEARAFYDRASRRAARTGRRRQAAVARHYIFALEAEHGSFESGVREARETLNLYPVYDRRVPYLVHDYAFFLIRHRLFSYALPLLEKLVPAISKPDEQVLVLSNLAWAAAGLGRGEQYRQAGERAVQLIDRYPEYGAAALIHLAHAARLTGDRDAARRHAAAAEQLAVSRGEEALAVEAAELVNAIAARIPPERHAAAEDAAALESLQKRFAARLRRWLAPDRRGSGASDRTGPADRERRSL